MKENTIGAIQKLLNEEIPFNREYFLKINNNFEKYSETIENLFSEIEEEIVNLQEKIIKDAFSEDEYYSIEELDLDKFLEIENKLFEEVYNLKETIENNFEELEEIHSENGLAVSEDLKSELDDIIKNFISSEKIKIEENKFSEISEHLQSINKYISNAESNKKDLIKLKECIEESESEIESLDEEEEDYQESLKNLEETLEDELENKNSANNYLESDLSDIEGEFYLIEQIIEKSNYQNYTVEIIENYFEIMEEMIAPLDKIKLTQSLAEKEKEKSSIVNFLSEKNNSQEIIENVSFSNQQKIKSFKIFQDYSISFKEDLDEETIFNSPYNNKNLAIKIGLSYIQHETRKKPKYNDFFKKLFLKDNSFVDSVESMKFFFKMEQVLKNQGIDILEKKFLTNEKLYDFLTKQEKIHMVEKYSKSIISKKYKDLINKDSVKYFEQIYDSKISNSDLKSYVGTKMAAFKSSEDLNEALKNFINILNEFDMESIKKKNKNLNTNIIYENENTLIIKIKDFTSSKLLGSNSWCISRNESFFNNYVTNNNQYFVFDFSKDSKDIYSNIGITLKSNGDKRAAHLKNDRSANLEDIKKYKKIIFENDPVFINTLSQKMIEKYDVKYNKEKNKKSLKLN